MPGADAAKLRVHLKIVPTGFRMGRRQIMAHLKKEVVPVVAGDGWNDRQIMDNLKVPLCFGSWFGIFMLLWVANKGSVTGKRRGKHADVLWLSWSE